MFCSTVTSCSSEEEEEDEEEEEELLSLEEEAESPATSLSSFLISLILRLTLCNTKEAL